MKRKNLPLAFLVLILLSGFLYLPASAARSSALACTMRHTVKSDETLKKIAKKYNVSWRWLAVINDLSSDRVRTGQKLCVQLTDTTKVQAACTQIHTVKRGEDLSKIARQYGVTVQWLIRTNGLDDPNHIYAGNKLCVGNGTSGGAPPTQQPSNQTGVIPTFSVVSVAQDNSVTIKTSNFPANDIFDVRMGKMGTRGVNGTLAGTIESGKGGSFVVTFQIPANLYGSRQIAIRLESPDSGYFAYNWFYNN
jgi:LysM repeat protein